MNDVDSERVEEALEQISRDILDYVDRSSPDVFVPSEATLRHRRWLMFWSVLVIAVLGLGLWPDRVPILGVALEETWRGYFAVGAFVVAVYHVAMYKLLEYRDMLGRYARDAIVDFAFLPRLERATSRLEGLAEHPEIHQAWMTQAKSAVAMLLQESPFANRLLKEMLRWPPALLFGAAGFFIGRNYGPVLLAYVAASSLVIFVIWIERRLRKRAFVRANPEMV